MESGRYDPEKVMMIIFLLPRTWVVFSTESEHAQNFYFDELVEAMDVHTSLEV